MNIEVEYYKQKLEQEKALLEKELNSIGVPKKDNPEDWDVTPANREQPVESRDEMADRMEDIEEREATEVPLEARLKEVKHALKKIKEGQFGRCEISGEVIEEDRLKANSAARPCKNHIDKELVPLE